MEKTFYVERTTENGRKDIVVTDQRPEYGTIFLDESMVSYKKVLVQRHLFLEWEANYVRAVLAFQNPQWDFQVFTKA